MALRPQTPDPISLVFAVYFMTRDLNVRFRTGVYALREETARLSPVPESMSEPLRDIMDNATAN